MFQCIVGVVGLNLYPFHALPRRSSPFLAVYITLINYFKLKTIFPFQFRADYDVLVTFTFSPLLLRCSRLSARTGRILNMFKIHSVHPRSSTHSPLFPVCLDVLVPLSSFHSRSIYVQCRFAKTWRNGTPERV